MIRETINKHNEQKHSFQYQRTKQNRDEPNTTSKREIIKILSKDLVDRLGSFLVVMFLFSQFLEASQL